MVLSVLAVTLLLVLGVLTSFAMGDDVPPAPTTTTTTVPSTTSPTTTAPTTSTTDPTTTAPTTTAPVTTTAPTTTDPLPPTTNNTTTAPVVTAANTTTVPPEQTVQAAAAPPEPQTTTVTVPVTTTITQPTTTTQPTTPPTAPCDTTQITCGNNAATQIALVSQTCNSSSANSTLNVQVQTLSGAPVNNVTIAPQTSCLNFAEITQIVEQFCVGCTVIVIPPPPPVIYVPVPGTNTVTNSTTTVQLQPQTQTVNIMAYCMPKPVMVNGVPKILLYLPVGMPQRNVLYAKAIPAKFVPGYGMKCGALTNAELTAAHVPTFTLSVPASFVGQSLRLCLQPALTNKKPSCHTVPIKHGAIISVPVTSNLVATVVKTIKPKTKVTSKVVKSATSALAVVGGVSK
jgi:hypothetical protein